MLRGPCKHKQAVAEQFKSISADLIPENDPRIRAFYHYLATGTRQNTSWYRQLDQENVNDEDFSGAADVFGFMRMQNLTHHLSTQDDANFSADSVANDIMDESIGTNVELDSELSLNTETIKEEFITAIVDFKDEILKRFEEDPTNYSKCMKSFTKQLKAASVSSHSVLQKTMFSFNEENAMPAKTGR